MSTALPRLHPKVRAYLLRRLPNELLLDQLIATAEALDWNMSAVAERLKLARLTPYARLKAAGLMYLVPPVGTKGRVWDRRKRPSSETRGLGR